MKKIMFGLLVALISVSGAQFASAADSAAALFLKKGLITGRSAEIILEVTGNLTKNYNFALDYGPTLSPTLNFSAYPSCNFTKSDHLFSDGTKICTFNLPSLSADTEYTYKLKSDPIIGNLDEYWGEDHFTTLTAEEAVQHDGLCGKADISNMPEGVPGEPVGDGHPDILCYQGAPSAVSPAMNPEGWKWICKKTGPSGLDASCRAKKEGTYGPNDGVCDPRTHRTVLSEKPTAHLCTTATNSSVVETPTGWEWTCLHRVGTTGQDQTCQAIKDTSNQDGNGGVDLGEGNSGVAQKAFCGTATSDATLTSKPTSGLCNPGTAGTVSGSGTASSPWEWICSGISGGLDAGPCRATAATEGGGGGQDGPSNFLQNPFKELDSFPKIIAAVINNIVLPIAVPFIAVMIIYSGILFVLARESGGIVDLKKAKQVLKYTLIGAGLVLGAFVIANALQGTLNDLLGYTASVAYAADINQFTGHTGGNWGSFTEIINAIGDWLNRVIIPILVSLAIAVFIWNIGQFIRTMNEPKAHEQFRKYSINAVIAIFVLISVWGIVGIGTRALFGGDPIIPQLQTSDQP